MKRRQHDADDGLAIMPLYARDWRASKSRAVLSKDGRLAFLELLIAAWLDGASLPDNEAELAALSGLTAAEWRRVRDEVLARFPIGDDGRRRNKRLTYEFDKARARRERQRAGAEEVNRRRAEATVTAPDSGRLPAAKRAPPSPSPSPSPLFLEQETTVVVVPEETAGAPDDDDDRGRVRPTACPVCQKQTLFLGDERDHKFCGTNRGGCGLRFTLPELDAFDQLEQEARLLGLEVCRAHRDAWHTRLHGGARVHLDYLLAEIREGRIWLPGPRL